MDTPSTPPATPIESLPELADISTSDYERLLKDKFESQFAQMLYTLLWKLEKRGNPLRVGHFFDASDRDIVVMLDSPDFEDEYTFWRYRSSIK